MWVPLSEALPPLALPVRCRLQPDNGGAIQEHSLLHVQEDDVSWRVADGSGAELGYAWNVLAWWDEKSAKKIDGLKLHLLY